MKRVEMREATHSLAEYARDLHDETLVLTEGGKPVAALFPVGNADDEALALSTNRRFLEIIERSRARQEAEGGLSTEAVRGTLAEPKRSRGAA